MSAVAYFLAGETGPWRVTSMRAVRGVVLAPRDW